MKQIREQYGIVLLFFLILAVGIIFSWQKPQSNPISNTALAQILQPKVFAATNIANQSALVPILMYHHVGNLQDEKGIKYDQTEVDLTVSPEDFENQLRYFRGLGYHTVTLQQVYNNLMIGEVLPSKPIIFTFDDGYRDVFIYAIPSLKKYDYIGSFAIATSLLGRPAYARWDDIVAAHLAGMEIVSHTENHLDLSNPIYSDSDLRREIFDSKQVLEEKLGTMINFFVYPYGRYNPKVLQIVQDAGYKMALTTAFGLNVQNNSLLMTSRVRVHGQNGLEKLKKIFLPVPQNAAALLSP